MEQEDQVVRSAMVRFYIFRHGETVTSPDGETREDRLTEYGQQQARASGCANLNSAMVLNGALSSGMERATETVILAAQGAHFSLRRENIEITDALGYGWVGNEVPSPDFYKIEKQLFKKYGGARQVPIYAWLEAYPPAVATRGRLTEFLVERAKFEFVDRPSRQLISIVGGSHGPTAATAVLNTRETFGLDYADLVIYDVWVERYKSGKLTSSLVASRVRHCPQIK